MDAEDAMLLIGTLVGIIKQNVDPVAFQRIDRDIQRYMQGNFAIIDLEANE